MGLVNGQKAISLVKVLMVLIQLGTIEQLTIIDVEFTLDFAIFAQRHKAWDKRYSQLLEAANSIENDLKLGLDGSLIEDI